MENDELRFILIFGLTIYLAGIALGITGLIFDKLKAKTKHYRLGKE